MILIKNKDDHVHACTILYIIFDGLCRSISKNTKKLNTTHINSNPNLNDFYSIQALCTLNTLKTKQHIKAIT